MKKIFYLLCAATLLASCDTWLDVNTNPDQVSVNDPTVDQRLPSILAQFSDSYESTGTRSALISQHLAVATSSPNNNWYLTAWRSMAASTAWPWQCWYVNTAVNLDPLIAKAEEVGAYHYIGVAKIIKAMGFATLSDMFGMMPYDEAFIPEILTPKFDDGEYIYEQAFKLLDEAIVELSKQQTNTLAPALKKGDIWNGGNVNSWIKLAYGLKARYLVHLSKKSSYNPDNILAALAKAPISQADNTIMQYIDESPNTSSNKEALQYSNVGTAMRLTNLYVSYLNNTYPQVNPAAVGILDPRIDLLVPSFQEWDGAFTRSKGVDMASNLPKTGPVPFSYFPAPIGRYLQDYNDKTGKMTETPDTAYVPLRRAVNSTDGRITSTGTWYTKRDSKGLILTNSEMRFIEAEVQFRKGLKDLALEKYKEGIRNHMQILGVKTADAEAYIASAAVAQSGSELTMSHIMIQKYIALSFSPEVFVDVRRHDFCTVNGVYDEINGVYKGFKRPSHVYELSFPNSTDWPRRFAVASYEINYNSEQVLRKDPSAASDTYINKPIWWDKP